MDERKWSELLVEASPVGQVTGSRYHDFYVYEWYIVETGEIFYVGKGRGDRYKRYHERAIEAEKIRKLYNTDVRFVGEGLSELEAIELEDKEMLRILNYTNYRLTNRITPLIAQRGNGFSPSPTTPTLEFEKAPVLWASEIDEHYFDIHHKLFDIVELENLKGIHFINKKIVQYEILTLYGGDYKPYYDDVYSWIYENGNHVIKSKFAKSVTAWVYIGDDDVQNYYIDQRHATERLGREIPVYHLLDIWKFIKAHKKANN